MLYRCRRGCGDLSAMPMELFVCSVREKGIRTPASARHLNSMKINSAAPILCPQRTFYFPLCLAHISLTPSQVMNVRKRPSPSSDGRELFPKDFRCLSEAGPSNPNTTAPEPWISTQGAHLLIMLLYWSSGITVAELGPLCPTQVTDETAAITQISRLSLSHSNYLTSLASRHPRTALPSCYKLSIT